MTTQEVNPSLTLDCDLLKCLRYQVYGALATSAGVFAVEVGKLLTKVKRQIIFIILAVEFPLQLLQHASNNRQMQCFS